MKSSPKDTIIIELDGVLNEFSGDFHEKYIPPAKPNVKEFLQNLSKVNRIEISTKRDIKKAKRWLIKNGLYKFVSDIINE